MENSNLTEVTNSSQSAKEVSDTITLKDRNGYEHVVINMDNPKYAAFEGIVELIPTKYSKGITNANGSGSFRHKAQISWSVVKDRNSQMLIGVTNGFDPKTGEIRWQKQVVSDVEFLDLAIPAHRRKFICIKYGPFLETSPNFNSTSKTTYRMVDKEKEAVEYMVSRRKRASAAKIAEALQGEELAEFALLLGLDPKFMSPAQLYMDVLKYAEDDRKINGKSGAERFMEVYEGANRNELIILKRGMSVGIVVESPNGIQFNGIVIGHTDTEAANYLKNNPATAVSIDTQSKSKQSYSKSSVAGSEPVNEKLSENELLKRQLAELSKENNALKAAELEKASMGELSKEDSELATLIADAKSIGVSSPHLIARNKLPEERKAALEAAIQKARTEKNN